MKRTDDELEVMSADLERWLDDLERRIDEGTATLEWDGVDREPRHYIVRTTD